MDSRGAGLFFASSRNSLCASPAFNAVRLVCTIPLSPRQKFLAYSSTSIADTPEMLEERVALISDRGEKTADRLEKCVWLRLLLLCHSVLKWHTCCRPFSLCASLCPYVFFLVPLPHPAFLNLSRVSAALPLLPSSSILHLYSFCDHSPLCSNPHLLSQSPSCH